MSLTSEEAATRLKTYGPNEIRREEVTPAWVLLLRQFESPLIWLLLAACILSAWMADVADAVAIASILLVNAIVGFAQESKAQRAILALRSMTAPRARVVRDGHSQVVLASTIVPGDILLLEAGDIVAADARLLEAHSLEANESALTGESVPVEKRAIAMAAGTPLAERSDHVFLGTAITRGSAKAEVVATGMQTELGKIAHLLATAKSGPTPLQVRLAELSRSLLIACLGIVGIIAVIGVLQGRPWLELVISSISLAVAAVPEGMPAIVTVALALGVQRMARRNVLVRRLHAVETMGGTTVICTDKTGTLTTGKMAVRELWGPDHKELIRAAASCCDADLNEDQISGTGDPTEVAILVEAAGREISRERIEATNPRRSVVPFDSESKRMIVERADGLFYVKGALESVLPLCQEGTQGAEEAQREFAEKALRVLAVAVGPAADRLKLLGLIGLADPPRTEAIEAVAEAKRAGIKTVMITGDHPVTARAIARELGILGLHEDPKHVLHARATASDKIDIVREWKRQGAIVAMTGDGVNDAPAMRESHIGIAMGIAGTEVTRESAAVVLADDNYASIVAGIREGRGVFNNIRKALVFLVAGNAGELLVMLVAAAGGLPLPLLPIQLLWINLVTDGLPALALVAEPVRMDVMKQSPRQLNERILGGNQWRWAGTAAMLDAVMVIATFAWTLNADGVERARAYAFSVLVFCQMFRALSARSSTQTFWQLGVFTNVWLLFAVVLSIVLQLALYYFPFTQGLFRLTDVSQGDWGILLFAGLVPVSVLELAKVIRQRTRLAG